MNCLGIDWGKKRIGLAMGNSDLKMAFPLTTVFSLDEVLVKIKEEDIEKVILGRPIKMSGDKENLNPDYKIFLKQLKDKLKIPLVEIDERLSSKQADSLEGDKKTKASRDEISAMIILQSYFDAL